MRDFPSVLTRVSREQPIMYSQSELARVCRNYLCETFFIADFIKKLIVGQQNQIPGWHSKFTNRALVYTISVSAFNTNPKHVDYIP